MTDWLKESEPREENKALSVRSLTNIIKTKFDNHLGDYYTIQGEVQNLTNKHHFYFALKDLDDKVVIRCIIWYKTALINNYILKNGDIITVKGKLNVYEVQNSYSFSIFKMIKEETKETEFQKKYELLKNKGYFDKHNIVDKTKIRSMALITSLQGQALHDFKKTLSNRFFYGKIYQYNVNVQGVKCASDVMKAIKFFEKTKKFKVDLLLITRGGGSSLDMDEFNNMDLIETIYKCEIPCYCAIGHEKDYSLCDYVCDLRSSTPTSLALEISDDVSKIDNKIKMIYETQKNIFEKQKNTILFNNKELKTKIYQMLMENKPSGFYFNNKTIKSICEFKKLCNETFTIQLADGIIEFQITNHTIKEKFNQKYTYTKYMSMYEKEWKNPKSNNLDIADELENLYKLQFGTKEHFDVVSALLKEICSNIQNINHIDNLKEVNDTHNTSINNLKTFVELGEYKKYLNHLNNLFEVNFVNYEIGIKYQNETNVLDLYNNYEGDEITEDLLELYLRLINNKPKYYKIKSSLK